MSAIQTGSAVYSTVWQETGPDLPRFLPGLLTVIVLLSLLLLTAINFAQLITLKQMEKLLEAQKRPKRKEALQKTSRPIPKKEKQVSPNETADLPYGEMSGASEISITVDENRKPTDSRSKNTVKDTQSETTDRDTLQSSQEKDSRSVHSNKGDNKSVLTSDIEKPPIVAPFPLYPVKISSSVNYNPLLPVQFQKTSVGDAVFTLWSDLTIRPSDICYLGFNNSAYYSSNRFQNAFDFIDQQRSSVDISKIKSMKLSEVSMYAVVSLHADSILLRKKGKIKVEVMK